MTDPAYDLRSRTGGARVLVADDSFTNRFDASPAFVLDTEVGVPQAASLSLALRARREGTSLLQFQDDELLYAMPLFNGDKVEGVVVVERNLTEVTTAVKLVRNALFTAAAVGLAVAIGLGLALSSTLTRRLGRLQRAALRITEEGPEAPAPTDRGADEVGDLARALGRMQEELRRQEAARRAFVSTASHELRTPLTMLQGTMELLDEDLRDGGDLADAQEQVESARRELRRLSVLASRAARPLAPGRRGPAALASPSSSARSPAPWPPSSPCAPPSATWTSTSCRPTSRAGPRPTRPPARGSCAS